MAETATVIPAAPAANSAQIAPAAVAPVSPTVSAPVTAPGTLVTGAPATAQPTVGSLITDPVATAPVNASVPGQQPTDPNAQAGEVKPPEVAPVVPEKYEFKAPEGMQLYPPLIEKFSAVAKELKLTQEQAQGLVDLQTGMLQEQQKLQEKNFQEARDQVRQETLQKFPEPERVFAATAWKQFGTPELNDLLTQTGLGDHPAMMGLFSALGKAISEDHVQRQASPSAAPMSKSDKAKQMYDHSDMK